MTEEKEATEEVEEKAPTPRKKAPSKKTPPKKTPPKKAVVPSVPVKRYSFTQWAARRGIRSHHRAGLSAFVTNVNKHRTLEEWDKCFEGY